MTSDYISYLALLASVVSLVISFLALFRDRHVVKVRAVPIQEASGVVLLNVTVSNAGKRPIAITHVLLKPDDHPGLYVDFAPPGQNKVDVGESRACQIGPKGLPVTWSSVRQLRSMSIYVQDALGKTHKARWQGKMPN